MSVHTFQIHDFRNSGEGQVLTFNLTDVLEVLGKRTETWMWCVRDVDAVPCVGAAEAVDAIIAEVQAAGAEGVWMDSVRLQHASATFHHILEGSFVAFPLPIEPHDVPLPERQVGRFDASRADLAIWVIEGTVFEVFCREASLVESFENRFKDVRLVDPAPYFR